MRASVCVVGGQGVQLMRGVKQLQRLHDGRVAVRGYDDTPVGRWHIERCGQHGGYVDYGDAVTYSLLRTLTTAWAWAGYQKDMAPGFGMI